MEQNPVLLELHQVCASYGNSPVLHEISMQVQAGQIVSILGRNGAGRSSLLKTIIAMLAYRGEILWQGQSLRDWPGWKIARAGIAYVPESRDVFPTLTTAQNLRLGQQAPRAGKKNWTLAEIYQLFPRLLERADTAAANLSGGEQQMLSIARSLLGNPELILIDEPTEGLAPQIVTQLATVLRQLQRDGVGILLVEQKLDMALDISDKLIILGQGRIVFEGDRAEFDAASSLRQQWLEV